MTIIYTITYFYLRVQGHSKKGSGGGGGGVRGDGRCRYNFNEFIPAISCLD